MAIVHDDFIQHGGAERLVSEMLKIWPKADLYAVMGSDDWRRELKIKDDKETRTSWLQRFPAREKLFRHYYSLYPLAIESFCFDDYDLVISSSARYAHGVITKPETTHIAYVNSLARFLWDEALSPKNILVQPVLRWHRTWDRVASLRPDFIIANSRTPAKRIETHWGRRADTIIYPFVDLEKFEISPGTQEEDTEGYFLIVSRLEDWKRIDLAIKSCNRLSRKLYIVGEGRDGGRLKNLAGPTIKFLGWVKEDELSKIYKNSLALIITQKEDFGITSLESQAAGRPVIAFRSGGALETVVENDTGVFFDSQTVESLTGALNRFDPLSFLRENCQSQARRFGKDRFRRELRDFVENVLRNR